MLKNKFIVSLLLVFVYHDHGASDGTEVSVKEGDSVTLYTNNKTNKINQGIMWYFYDIRIARISGDQSKICIDVQCNEVNERFRGRLKLDHQTGSLTIMNIRTEHAGVYQLKFSSSSSKKIFNVDVHGVPAGRDKVKRKTVKGRADVTLETSVVKHPNDVMKWYHNDTPIAEITGDQSKICTGVQCEERFRDRLKLDHQTGSLTITDTRNTDTGEYTLEINISTSSFSIRRNTSFSVTVTADPGSGLSAGAIVGICVAVAVGVLLLFIAVARRADMVKIVQNVHNRVKKKEKSQDPQDQCEVDVARVLMDDSDDQS